MAQPTQQAEILEVRSLSLQVRELAVKPLERPIAYRPGQWVSLHLPNGKTPPLVRAYTMAEPERAPGELVLAFDRVPGGLGSGYLECDERRSAACGRSGRDGRASRDAPE